MIDKKCPTPLKIILHKISRTLEIEFDNKESLVIACAILRAASPSAEMKHGKPLKDLDYSSVNILTIEPVGNYAIKPIFSDGHRTGIFSWRMLYDLGKKSNQ
jgi:DUF971 family protein